MKYRLQTYKVCSKAITKGEPYSVCVLQTYIICSKAIARGKSYSVYICKPLASARGSR